MKTFEEYLDKMGYSWNDFDRTYEMENLIEQYADERVNQVLRIHDVVGSASLTEGQIAHQMEMNEEEDSYWEDLKDWDYEEDEFPGMDDKDVISPNDYPPSDMTVKEWDNRYK